MERIDFSGSLNFPRKGSANFAKLVLSVALLLLCLGYADSARAQSQVRAVRLSDVEGGVQILRGDQTEFEQAFRNMPVLEGSRLQTGNDGRAEVQFEDGAVARLTPNTSVNFNQLSRASSGGTLNQVEVLSGLAYFEVGADRKQQYSILFGRNVVTPNETSTFRVNMDATPAELVVLQGSVQAVNPSVSSVNVREGETLRFDPEDARYFLAANAEPDSWDQWNLDRDQALASMASRQTAVSGVGDQSGAGWSDLDQYGDWYNVPQYGNVWAPRGVDVGWDPYGSGYWAYYPRYGYVWVSSNPWGWLPYRCGGWSYFDSFGWGWLPSGCGNGWLTDINIWNAPSYYIKPQRPHPVGPRDNLPTHGTLIAVNRGRNGGERALPGSATDGLVRTNPAPRTFLAGGRVIRPLPKTVVEQTVLAGATQPRRPAEFAGPVTPTRLPANSSSRYQPMTAPRDQGRPGYEPGVPTKSEYDGKRLAPAPAGGVQSGLPPYLTSPRPSTGPVHTDPGTPRSGYSAPAAPRPAPPAYAPPPRNASPPSYSPAPRYEPPAPRYEPPSRSSSPAPEARSSPQSSPAPAPAAAPKK